MSQTSVVRSLITVFCLSILLTLISSPVRAQTGAARPDRGTRPNGSYSVSDIENINLQNGNVNLTIPLASLPPIAGGKLEWTLSAHYNSKIWDVVRIQEIGQAFDLSQHYYVVDTVQASDRGGWRVTGQYSLEIRDANADNVADASKHGNSLSSTKPQHGYELVDQSGGVQKVGVSGGPINKDGTSRRANKQVNAANKTRTGKDRVKGEVRVRRPNRRAIIAWEKKQANKRKKEGHPMEMHKRP